MSSKPRQPRLRASCDGCFLAKVKCSKARPICSRCLACGIECRYSPSSRAGKPKADGSSHHHSHSHSHSHQLSPSPADMAAMAAAAGFSSIAEDKGMLYTTSMPGMVWQNHIGMDAPVAPPSRNHSVSSELALLAMDENTAAMVSGADVYGASMPWTPPADMSMAQFADAGLSGLPMTPHSGYAIHAAASSGLPWMDAAASIDALAYSNGHAQGPVAHQQMPTPSSSISSTNTYFPSPSTTPSLRQSPPSRHKTAPLSSPPVSSHHNHHRENHGHGHGSNTYQGYAYAQNTCVCFTSCLQALQELHNASAPVPLPFDVVLALNRSAVDGCAAMLSCPRCMSRSGTHTAAMLLATVIGKVASSYKNESQRYFAGGPATALSLDAIVGGMDMAGPAPGEALCASGPAATSLLTGLGVSLGAYHVQGDEGRWLELEIISRELRKLQDVYGRFRAVCGELSEDVEVSKAMIGYLDQNLGSTLNMVTHSKGYH